MIRPKYNFTADQLIKDGRVTTGDIADIKSWVARQANIPELSDEQLSLFLISCSNDAEATKDTIKEFYAVRLSSPVIFDNRNLQNEEFKRSVDIINYCMLPERTDDDYSVVCFSIRDTNYRNFELAPAFKGIVMSVDTIVSDYPPNGFIAVFNMEGFGLLHLTKFRINLLSPFFRFIQNGMYIKLKEIHVLNTTSWVDKLLTILKPFIKTELLQRMHFHPPHVDKEWFFENCVPKRCVPSDLGGSAPEIRVLHEQTIAKFIELESYFSDEEKQRHSVDI